MGLFDKIKEPIFVKESSNAQLQLSALESLRPTATGKSAERIDEEISKVSAGIVGEKAVHFKLANSHIPMFVLHDLFFEHNGLSAQIDYLVITRKHVFVLECKNLYGNIEIDHSGNFIRTTKYGRQTKKEGIYSPITQNRRHLELIKAILSERKTNLITQAIFEKYFFETYRSIVVLANSKTVLYDRYAKREIKSQVIRADQLSDYIRNVDKGMATASFSEKAMEELAQFFLSQHREQTVDYKQQYTASLQLNIHQPVLSVENGSQSVSDPEKKTIQNTPIDTVLCPRCGSPMVRRIASRGANAGKEFYGCSRYPHCRGIVNIR